MTVIPGPVAWGLDLTAPRHSIFEVYREEESHELRIGHPDAVAKSSQRVGPCW